jgi:hypothetical protein
LTRGTSIHPAHIIRGALGARRCGLDARGPDRYSDCQRHIGRGYRWGRARLGVTQWHSPLGRHREP